MSAHITGSLRDTDFVEQLYVLSERIARMDVDASDGRIYLPKDLRERFGERYELFERADRLVLIPVSDDPLASFRAAFADVDGSAVELREAGRETALDEAGS